MYMTYAKLVISTTTIMLAETTADAPRCASRLRYCSCSYLMQLTTSADNEIFTHIIAIASSKSLC